LSSFIHLAGYPTVSTIGEPCIQAARMNRGKMRDDWYSL